MSKRKMPDLDYSPFANLAVKTIIGANGRQNIAVHISGIIDDIRPPIICIADYYRNMADFEEFIYQFRIVFDADWPIVLIDLAGRGRSENRRASKDYSSMNDAGDVATALGALGIERAIFLGQGHGGRVIMALGCKCPQLVCASILIDAAPVLYAPGLVRLRDNLLMLMRIKNPKQFRNAATKIYSGSYPAANEDIIGKMIARVFFQPKAKNYFPIFDPALLDRLQNIEIADVFEPQWALFATLNKVPLMLMRTQLSDQLERTTFEHMGNLRTDAIQLIIADQGSPALLSGADEVGAIADFARHVAKMRKGNAIVSG